MNYSFSGNTARSNFLPSGPEDYQAIDFSWNVTGIEVVETPMGTFETYRVEMTRELFQEYAGSGTFYNLNATYWYHPAIGVVKADIIEKKRYSGESTPYLVIAYDYSIKGTNISF